MSSGDGLPRPIDRAAAYVGGDDPLPLIARVCGEDWVFHQLCTFELGGLFVFLRSLATGRLQAEAGLCEQWFGARMGGYRLDSSDPGSIVVHDLARDEVRHQMLLRLLAEEEAKDRQPPAE